MPSSLHPTLIHATFLASIVSVDVVARIVLATTPTTATHPTLMHAKVLAKSSQPEAAFTDSHPMNT